MTTLPNISLQRTRTRVRAAELGSFGAQFIAAALCIVGTVSWASSSDQWKSRLQFVSAASIQIEKRTSPLVQGNEKEWRFSAVTLSPKEIDDVRAILIAALHDNQRSKKEARAEGAISGGVPGCASYDFRVTFRLHERTVPTWLHLGSGWLAGGPEVGDILLSQKKTRRLEGILGSVNPC